MVMPAKLEKTNCLIVYFAFKTCCCDMAHSTKTFINKIYLQMLVQVLRRANLICSFSRFFQADQNAVCNLVKLVLEVKTDLTTISAVTKQLTIKLIVLPQSKWQSLQTIEAIDCG
jgi:hypothetical protein